MLLREHPLFSYHGMRSWPPTWTLIAGLDNKHPIVCYRNQRLLFKQNSNQGVGFMALARLAHDKARKAGIGIEI